MQLQASSISRPSSSAMLNVLRKKLRSRKNKRVARPIRQYVNKTVKHYNELKEDISSSTATAYTTLTDFTWVVDSILSVAQGTTSVTREGDKILLSRIQANPTLYVRGGNILDLTVHLNPSLVRVVLFQCKRGFTTAQVLALFPVNNALAPMPNLVLRACHILKDRVYKQDTNVSVHGLATLATSSYIKYPQVIPVKMSARPKIAIAQWRPASTGAVEPDIVGAIGIAYCKFPQGTSTDTYPIYVDTDPDSRITFRDK